eukprot:Blabericola_migrator_1__4236@NODE_229_length_11083_cov_77_301198_g195_i0_p5_GENE_NODE_229_length_11083_cov_77_301198_g195_i0NODE_229_length_11083_cov_77_301198_g195_i0_p5_ORF_typecomplete_len266_score21_70GT87/PF09594_10/0_056TMEM154/PF15102_6/0_32TMEM154/PF15102_6/95DUF4381/PF14316_6/2_9e03DUF4381/PF14316_6/0_15EVI2A/PF05399_11/1_9EVI2A/PF05399_11/73_NODE_229_length_11083_cov_77_301198_g195_i042685065
MVMKLHSGLTNVQEPLPPISSQNRAKTEIMTPASTVSKRTSSSSVKEVPKPPSDFEPLDTEDSLESASSIALALLICITVLSLVAASLAPFVRYLQRPPHDGPSVVWGEQSESRQYADVFEESMSGGPRAPVAPLNIIMWILIATAVLCLACSVFHEISKERRSLHWYERNYLERGSHAAAATLAQYSALHAHAHAHHPSLSSDGWGEAPSPSLSQGLGYTSGVRNMSALSTTIMQRHRYPSEPVSNELYSYRATTSYRSHMSLR